MKTVHRNVVVFMPGLAEQLDALLNSANVYQFSCQSEW